MFKTRKSSLDCFIGSTNKTYLLINVGTTLRYIIEPSRPTALHCIALYFTKLTARHCVLHYGRPRNCAVLCCAVL